MESKSVIVSVLLMSLVMAQIQVEAKSCCPSTAARNIYNSCRFAGRPRPFCATISRCKIINASSCPPGYNKATLQTDGDVANEYCKLGCVSSECAAIATLKNSDPSEVADDAVEKCTNACAAFCAKGSTSALRM